MKGSGRKVTATMSGALHAVRQSVLSPAAFTGSEEEEEEPEQCADTANLGYSMLPNGLF